MVPFAMWTLENFAFGTPTTEPDKVEPKIDMEGTKTDLLCGHHSDDPGVKG